MSCGTDHMNGSMMKKLKVLLAEDEPFLGKIIKESLTFRGFDVTWVPDGIKAYSAFRTLHPDICILDVMMPMKDGFTLITDIRKIDEQVPIIFLTAKSLTTDVVKGFELGCNDYLKKPFSMEELLVRIKALIDRSSLTKKEEEIDLFHIGRFVFNSKNQELCDGAQCTKLSFRESALLKMLVEHKNEVLNRKMTLDFLWGEDNFFNARSMDVFISKLRKYLQRDPCIEIVNIRGIGYKLIVQE